MKWILETLSQELINAIGWTLIHSIWQGALIALSLALLFWILHRHSAQVRYLSAISALLLMLITSVGTFFYFLEPSLGKASLSPATNLEMLLPSAEPQGEEVVLPMLENVSASAATPDIWGEIIAYFHRHLPMIVVIWLMGVLLLLLKLIGGIAYVQRLKSYRTQPVAEIWLQQLDKLSRRLQVNKTVRLIESAIVKTPMVIGHLKPVILLPAGLLAGLPPEQVEVVLAHELAHIRRHDYLINILQRLVELLFFYHPAVWWLSTMVRTEREHCCDDLAVGVSGDSLTFAKALASIQELGLGQPTMAMTFAGKKKQILSRVNRLLKGSSIEFSPTEGFIMAGILFFSIFLINVNADARLEPHEAVEFMGGGITNKMMVRDDIEVPQQLPDLRENTVNEPDTVIYPSADKVASDPEVDVEPKVDVDVVWDGAPPDTLPKNFSIIRNGQTFTITGNGTHTIYLDSLAPRIAEIPSVLSLSGVQAAAAYLADTVIGKTLRVRPSHPPVPARVMSIGRYGGYVPIAERFDNVTGTFTISYEEEERKYKTIKLTTEQGKVTSLEVNGEKISAIAIDAMIAEIDREGRGFGRKQAMDNVRWNFGEDGTFHWEGQSFEFDEEWEEKIRHQLEQHREQLEEAQEQIQQMQEQNMDVQDRQQMRIEERKLGQETRRLEQEARRLESMKYEEHQQEIIIDELFNDKLIDSKDKVELKISEKQMEVNGKKQPKEVLEKYIDLIEDVKGMKIDGDDEFTFFFNTDDE